MVPEWIEELFLSKKPQKEEPQTPSRLENMSLYEIAVATASNEFVKIDLDD